MKELELYIGDHLVELNDDTTVLYSKTLTDLQSPTAVKNSFSKTITIKGSPNNNRIFGMYWNVERRVGNGGPNSGVYFNASKKAPFSVYVNGELYETGYVKLNKINKLDGEYTYDISLFGGLSDFFYSLSFNENTGEKRKLSDLSYYRRGSDEFDFIASASTVNYAWDSLRLGYDNMWQHINFMPAYNGYPDDFDADKIIINLSGTSLPDQDESGLFRPKGGCVIADLPSEMTEWETRDLRSYLQRPCVRMKSIINACCNSSQNGGYTVNLDPDFFSSGNSYYEKTWLSLPLVKDLEYNNEEQILTGSRLIGLTTTGDAGTYMYQDLKFDIGDYGNSVPSSIKLNAKVFINNIFHNLNEDASPIPSELIALDAPYTSFAWFWSHGGDSAHKGWWCLGSLFVQALAFNGETVVGASKAYNLTSPIRHNGKLYAGNNKEYSKENQFKPYLDKSITDVLGSFQTDGFHRENSSSPAELNFNIEGLNSPVSAIKICYFWGATDDKIKHFSKQTCFGETEQSRWIDFGGPEPCAYYRAGEPYCYTVDVTSTDFKAVLGASLGRTGTKVTKSLLLNTEGSPCDYLLSFCKMFGLHFIKHIDSNTIDIVTRKTFYDRTNVVDLDEYIDRGKDVTINPIAFTTKWYQMAQEMDETSFYKKYKSSRGVEYGCKMLNTGYEFNTEKEDLLKDGVIRSGIEGLERSKYFSCFNNDRFNRSWMGMGLHYNLYLGETGASVDMPIINNNTLMGINENSGMKYYDVYPKLQFHDDDNKPTDGNNVLVFFSGFKDMVGGRTNALSYMITDDNAYQTILNDSTPCWMFSAYEDISGVTIGKRVQYLPVFERYLTNNQSGTVNRSLDFGTPQELYIPDYNITEDSNIYSNYWRSYIEDMFDPDTKILSCYVKVDGRLDISWFRRFYWFSNAVWRLNSYTDWDMRGGVGLTKMEFIKVQDIDGYNSMSQGVPNHITLTSSSYIISHSGGSATLTVNIANGGSWRIVADDNLVLSRRNGTGNGNITVTFPSNNTDDVKYFYFTVTSNSDDATARLTIMQSFDGQSDFKPYPENLIVPASGGDITVDFMWTNQGGDYVDAVEYGNEGLSFTADTLSQRSQNRAILSFSANSGNTILSNYCQFRNSDGDIRHSVGIDQLPDILNFVASGSALVLDFEHNDDVEFINVPDWITVTGSGGSYTLTARRNLYGQDNSGEIEVSNRKGSRAKVKVMQGNDGGINSDNNISPTNLGWGASETNTKFITAQMSSNYSVVVFPIEALADFGGWLNVEPREGNAGISVIAVSPTGRNTLANDRGAELRFIYAGGPQSVNVIQAGNTPYPTINVSPSASTISSAATEQEITVVTNGIKNPSSVSVELSDTGMTNTPIVWVGNTGTTTIGFDANISTSAKTRIATFAYGTIATASTVFTQNAPSGEVFILDTDRVNSPSSGNSTTLHPASNTCWTTGGGIATEYIGIATPTFDSNTFIDTGIYPDETNTTVRMKYIGRGSKSDRIMGTYPGIQGCTDGTDWRIFDAYYDYRILDQGADRVFANNYGSLSTSGVDFDLTMGNKFVYDNIGGSYIISSTASTIPTDYKVCIDVGSYWVKEVVIEKNGVVVFSGTPYSNNGVVGLYDSVSDSVKTLYSGSSATLIASGSSSSSTIPSWITVTQSGCGNDTLTITTGLNTGDDRTGEVKIYSTTTGDLLKTITVYQEGNGARLSVSPSSIRFDSNGGTATFTITSNTNWTIQ